MSHFILQNVNSHEIRSARTVIMLSDEHHSSNCALESLHNFRTELTDGAIPIGSVEFVRAAMQVLSIQEPINLSYPPGCEPFLHRSVRLTPAESIEGRWFIKPNSTKTFTGFIYDSTQDPKLLNEHDREQRDVFLSLPKQTLIYACEPVQFLSEWRYYIQERRIIGQARYDDAEDDHAPVPQLEVIKECVRVLDIEHPYALDFGVLSDGSTALVEANDAWALGYYNGSMPAKRYLDMLAQRWQSILRLQRAEVMP